MTPSAVFGFRPKSPFPTADSVGKGLFRLRGFSCGAAPPYVVAVRREEGWGSLLPAPRNTVGERTEVWWPVVGEQGKHIKRYGEEETRRPADVGRVGIRRMAKENERPSCRACRRTLIR